jgi:hypothetical protein
MTDTMTSQNIYLSSWDTLYNDDSKLINEYRAVGGMRSGRGNRNTRRQPAQVPFCPQQTLLHLTWDRIQAAELGNRRITT